MKWLVAYGALLLAALALPIVVIVIGSLTGGERIVFPPEGLTLRWYAAFANDPHFTQSIRTSFEVAAMTSISAGCFGATAAFALAREQFPGSRWADAFLMAPLGIPTVALGLAFLILYTKAGIAGSKLGLVIGHTIVSLPFVLRLVRANFAGYNWNVERAAANLGARPLQVFLHVTLPLVMSGVLGGMIFAFIVSFDEVIIAIFLSGPDVVTLPVRIFSYLDQSPGPIVLAAGSVLIFFAVAFMLLLEWTVRIGRAFGVEGS
jgi:putative spermidine/putrescine transport system permease protein